jgi:hypothetical protein
MCMAVAAPRLYAVATTNSLNTPEAKMRVICRPTGCSPSNSDVERAALQSQCVYWKQAAKGNAGTFIAFLHLLHQSFPDQLLVLILDHCSIHQSQKVKAFVAKTRWLGLEHLAPYSPEYNPIERFWR